MFQLEQALTLACSPSPAVGRLAHAVARRSARQLSAAAALREAVSARMAAAAGLVAASGGGGGGGGGPMTTSGGGGQAAAMAAAAATAGLFAAIACAEGFTRLAGEEQAGGNPLEQD